MTAENTLAMPGLAPDGHALAYAKDGSLAFHPLTEGDVRPLPAQLPPDWRQLSLDGDFGVIRVTSSRACGADPSGPIAGRMHSILGAGFPGESAACPRTVAQALRPNVPVDQA